MDSIGVPLVNQQNSGPILGRSFARRKLTNDQRDTLGAALVLGEISYTPTIPQAAGLVVSTMARVRRALRQRNGAKLKNGNGRNKILSPADLAAAWVQLDEGGRDEVVRLIGDTWIASNRGG